MSSLPSICSKFCTPPAAVKPHVKAGKAGKTQDVERLGIEAIQNAYNGGSKTSNRAVTKIGPSLIPLQQRMRETYFACLDPDVLW